MSRTVKKMIIDQYREQFGDVTDAVLVDIRGVEANDNNTLRNELRAKGVRIAVVKNSLARQALAGTGLEGLKDLFEGPSALAYGGESVVDVARELIDWAKKLENLELRGAIMEGTVFPADEVERLSKFPTRQEALADAVTLVLSPARNLVASVTGPGKALASLIKAIEEKLEQGEAIAPVG